MILNANFPGDTIRFEGDRTVILRQLPAGAQIASARVTVTPVAPPGRPDLLFQEVLTFPGSGATTPDVGEWGMTRAVAPGSGATLGSVEVDFHARRTLAAVGGTNIAAATNGGVLLVDLGGGVFMRITQDGALATPDDTDFYNVPASGVLPGLTVTKFRLQAASVAAPQNLNVSQVTIRTVPTNVSVALGELPPFWTRVGEMTAAETSTDFAEFLQLFLSEAEVKDGYYEIPLVLHSDALTRLNLSVAIEYVVQESALPEGVGEVALPYGHGTVPQDGCEALQVALPVGAQVTRAAVRVLGSFESSRVAVGPTGPVTPTATAAIRPGRGQAQPIRLTRITPATAVDLLLSCTSQAAVLDLNVLGDVDGKPFGDPLLPRPVRIELDRDVALAPTWLSAALPEAFQFPAGRVWLAVQAREGEAAWHAVAAAGAVAEADPIGLHYSAASGLTWRATQGEGAAPRQNGASGGALAGLFRLRHVPPVYEVPLEVLVGQGDGATRVSLDRYRALGRIDFTIDFPEFADAINRAARAGEAGGAPGGEQLRNGDFARWTVAGDRIGAPQRVAGIDIPTTVTIASHGQWAYVGEPVAQPGEEAPPDAARFLDLPEHRGDADFSLPAPLFRQHVALRADGERIAVLTRRQQTLSLSLLDGRTRRVIGDLNPDPMIGCLAWSRVGRLLYVGEDLGESGQVRVLDGEALEQLLLRQETNLEMAMLPGAPFALEEGDRPFSLALSPDGQRLYVAALSFSDAGAPSEGRIYAFDTATRTARPGSPLAIAGLPADLTLTPDGRWLLAADAAGNALLVIDANRLTVARRIVLGQPFGDVLGPMAVEVAGDGRRAYVGNAAAHSISIVDLTTWQVQRPIVIPVMTGSVGMAGRDALIDLALTPTGDRLYAAVRYSDETDPYNPQVVQGLYYLTLGLPDEWTLTQGFVMPLGLGEPYRLAALFGPVTAEECAAQPPRPSSLSQAVGATGGRTYDFSFWGIATAAGAMAEVIWRGDACALQRTDRVPLRIDEDRAVKPCPAVDPLQPEDWPDLLLHRVRLVAPAGATQAEIRFITPPGKNAIVDAVSFQATAETTVNGDLLEVNDDGEVVGWQLAPATAAGVALLPVAGGLRLSNAGSQAASLLQSFPVAAAQPFSLHFEGEIGGVGAGGPPRVELHWLDEAGAPVGAITALAIQPDQTDHRLQATTPAAAVAAELHLVLPAGAALVVRRVAYAPVEAATVPICFVAQAPGDITVLGFDYAYDTPPTRPAPAPPGGLCPPTPPGRRPDGKSGCVCAYCATPCGPCCDEPATTGDAAVPPAVALRAVARPTRAVRVPVATGAGAMARGPLEAMRAAARPRVRPVEDDLRAFMVATPGEWAARAPDLAVASTPLTIVRGIGPGRAVALNELAIDSLPQLAAAAPERIADALRGVSPAIAAGYVAEARALLADPTALPAPLVSCIMPTYNRRDFAAQAIDLFRRQEYPNRELIIVDDGEEAVEDLIPGEAAQRADGIAIRYVRLAGRQSIGHKHNVACERAAGPIIAHWDDDTWYAPWRLSYQVAALVRREADLCGLDNVLHYNPATGGTWHSTRPHGPEPWMPGSTLCYRTSVWRARPFDDSSVGSDILFLRGRPDARIITLQSIAWLVDIIHGANASPKDPRSPLWQPYPAAEIRRLMGDDWAFYERLAGRQPAPAG